MIQRRTCLMAALAAPFAARAHHGWSSFDLDRPLFLQGRVLVSKWQNPHAELELELPPDYRLPPDVANLQVPAQAAGIDGKALLAKAAAPTRKDRRWHIELAPLTRLSYWKMDPIPVGATVGILGYTFKEEKGDPVLRAEYVYVGGKAYGLRSSPA
jgi:hypothetical protein